MVLHRGEQQSARAQLAWFLFWSACLLVSLRASAPPDPRLSWITAPLRFAADLASPLHLLRASRVHAAEGKLVRASQLEAEEHLRLLENLERSAEPRDPRVREGRHIVPAEVVGRESGNRDKIRIRMRDGTGVERGQPVACGDAYVGRVTEVIQRGSEGAADATVELVTAAEFNVGGRVEREELEEVFLIVGGLAQRDGDQAVKLDVQYPSDASVEGGRVRVFERFADAEPFAELAEGLVLGQLEKDDDTFRVIPELDYNNGLFHVVVLAPGDVESRERANQRPGLANERWVQTRALVLGDPSPWRSATKIPLGELAGVREGAAVTGVGGRFLGRVTRAGPLAANVSFLDDVGLRIVAVATLAGSEEPHVLGLLVSEGRHEPSGALRMRWTVQVPLGELGPEVIVNEDGSARARLFTGSGDEGLPSGLFFGETDLPLDVAPGETRFVLVEDGVRGADVRALFARIAPDFAGEGGAL